MKTNVKILWLLCCCYIVVVVVWMWPLNRDNNSKEHRDVKMEPTERETRLTHLV